MGSGGYQPSRGSWLPKAFVKEFNAEGEEVDQAPSDGEDGLGEARPTSHGTAQPATPSRGSVYNAALANSSGSISTRGAGVVSASTKGRGRAGAISVQAPTTSGSVGGARGRGRPSKGGASSRVLFSEKPEM